MMSIPYNKALDNFINGVRDSNFNRASSVIDKLFSEILEHPEIASVVVEYYDKYADCANFSHSDLMPALSSLFEFAVYHTEKSKVEKSLEGICKKNFKLYLMLAENLVVKHPEYAKQLYAGICSSYPLNGDAVYKTSYPLNSNSAYKYYRAMGTIAKVSEPSLSLKIINENFYNLLPMMGEIYIGQPALRAYIFSKIEKYNAPEIAPEYYQFFYDALKNGAEIKRVLYCIKNNIAKKQSSSALSFAYKTLISIAEEYPQHKELVHEIAKLGLKNPNNSRTSTMHANLCLERWQELRSSAIVGQRVLKSSQNLYGWKNIDSVDLNKPCIVCFCGSGTINESSANGYAKSVQNLLEKNKLNNSAVNIYSVAYNFGYRDFNVDFSCNDNAERNLQFKKYKHLKKSSKSPHIMAEDKNPQYIQQLFDMMFLPRISKNNGTERLPLSQAKKYMSKIIGLAHCHGAFVCLEIENKMQEKMQELGYSKAEISEVQQQFLVVAQSPYCPLGVSQSRMISFSSAKDAEVDHLNRFNEQLWEINQEKYIPLSYFPKKRGDLFVVSMTGMGEYAPDQHNFWGLNPKEGMAKDFRLMLTMECNAIVNGIKNALTENPVMLSTKDLVCGPTVSGRRFEQVRKNGEDLYAEIYARAKEQAKHDADIKHQNEMTKSKKRTCCDGR